MSNWQRWKGIMKCYPFEEKRLAKWEPPYIVQPKYDGDRCKAYPLDTGYILLSSEENPFFSVPHIVKSLGKYKLNINLDGELYNHRIYLEGGWELIHSIASRTVNIHPQHEELAYYVYDIENEKPQISRLHTLLKLQELNIPHIHIAPYWLCDSLDDIMRVYDRLINKGYEGMIVRNLHAPYEKKRSIWMMKFKPKKEDIYEIIGYSEEVSKDGTPKQRLGSLHLRSQEGDNFSVGSGLTDTDRDRLWRDGESLCGKSVKVQYQHLTSGKKVPRFPVFMEVI